MSGFRPKDNFTSAHISALVRIAPYLNEYKRKPLKPYSG